MLAKEVKATIYDIEDSNGKPHGRVIMFACGAYEVYKYREVWCDNGSAETGPDPECTFTPEPILEGVGGGNPVDLYEEAVIRQAEAQERE